MVTPFGIESAQAFAAIRARTSWRLDKVAILADVHDRTGNPLVGGTLEDDLDAAVRLGAADALVLTGKTYAGTHDLIATARRVVGSVPILVGGGVTADNVGEVQAVADGTVVSSSLKGTGTAFGRFDPGKVTSFMTAAARDAADVPDKGRNGPQVTREQRKESGTMKKFLTGLGTAAALAASLLASQAEAAKLKIAMITSESGLGDRSFNDMMNEGMKKAKADLDADYVVIQPRSISEFQSSLARAAGQGFDLIVGSSFDMIKPMQTVAKAFPDQKFGLLDVGPDPIGPNVASTVTKDWEGSFLVGAIAAKVTKTGTIGFVGGKDIPIIHRIYIGYYYGAKMADPKVNVLESYSGTFTDPAAGKEYTLALINQKSDINFAVAGATSAGVIDAAKSTNTFAHRRRQRPELPRTGPRADLHGEAGRHAGLRHDQGGEGRHLQGRQRHLLRAQGGRRRGRHGRVQQGADSRRCAEAGRRPESQGHRGRDRGAQLLRSQAGPEGDGHAADGHAALDRRQEVITPRPGLETAGMPADLVAMRGIVKRFGDFVAIHDASLAIRPGEVHALVGENGAGKSTLMNILYGLLPRTGGEVSLRGRPVDFAGPAEAIAAGIGMVHQHFQARPLLHGRGEHHSRRRADPVAHAAGHHDRRTADGGTEPQVRPRPRPAPRSWGPCRWACGSAWRS